MEKKLGKKKRESQEKKWLENPENATNPLAIFAQGIENSKRPTRVAKVHKAYQIFRDLLYYHAAKEWLATAKRNPLAKPLDLLKSTLKIIFFNKYIHIHRTHTNITLMTYWS